jgi:hypothetical protein
MSKITRIPELSAALPLSGSELIVLTQQDVTLNTPVSSITKSINENIVSLYSYLVDDSSQMFQGFASTSLQQFIGTEWSPSLGLNVGDTIVLSASNSVYILKESDGSGVSDYISVNLKPNKLIFKTNLAGYGTLDVFPLSTVSSAKYIVEVTNRDDSNLYFSELNVISNGVNAVICEYGINSTATVPFVEYGAYSDSFFVYLTANGINGKDMSNFTFKVNRTNLF